MAHHKSALKRIRQSNKRRLYNRLNKKLYKEALKSVRNAKTGEDIAAKLKSATRILDIVAARGVIHKNKAANLKSSLTKHANKLQSA